MGSEKRSKMPCLNGGQIVKKISKDIGVEEQLIEKILQSLRKILAKAIWIDGMYVRIRGLFNVFLRDYKEKTGYDVKNRKTIIIPAKKRMISKCTLINPDKNK